METKKHNRHSSGSLSRDKQNMECPRGHQSGEEEPKGLYFEESQKLKHIL
jgi:hypothetical protein